MSTPPPGADRYGARTARRRRLPWLASAIATLACVVGVAAGQPYAADGGFDRPRVGFPLARASLAAAVDEGRPRLLIGDASGLRLVDLQAGRALESESAEWLARGVVVRGVAAADGWEGGPAVYAWFVRDTTSGAYHYTWRWGDAEAEFAVAPQTLDLAVSLGAEGPEAWLAVPTAAGGRLERHAWGASGAEDVVISTRTLAAPVVDRDADGALHLAYLEGSTVDSPIGVRAEWAVVYRAPDGSETRFDDALGPPARIALDAREPAVLLWERGDGVLVATTPHDGAHLAMGRGRAVGVAAGRAFWGSGASIVATPLPARDSPVAGGANVAWSPYVVDRTALTHVDGVTFLAWAGTLPGGAGVALSSDDATPMQRGWRDVVAAWFGWTPWSLGEEALGQVTGALLVGVLGTMVLFPLFWLVSLPIARTVSDAWSRPVGALVAAATLLVIALIAVARASGLGHDVAALLGGYWGLALALVAGIVVAPTLLARADLEKQSALLASAGIAGFVSLSALSFIAFQPWLDLFGL